MAAPEKNYKSGSVDCAIWKNENERGTYYSFSLSKSYKTKDGEWKTTANFSLSDMGDIIAICQRVKDRAIKERTPTHDVERVPAENVEAGALDTPF